MSTAEQAARNVYNEYHLGELPTDVKRQLIILFLNSPSIISQEKDGAEENIPQISVDALRQRAEKSFSEAKEGKGEPIDKLFDKLEAKYKWL